MRLVVFTVFLVLYFYEICSVSGQSTDNPLVIDYSPTDFLIERSFTISLTIPNSDTRPTVAFPDIPGLVRQGIAYSTTRSETGGREVVSQIIVQSYLAARPGTIRVPPFTLTAAGQSVRSPGVVLTVRAVASPAAAAAAAALVKARNDRQAAFLQTSVNQVSLYTGDGLRIRLSFFVAENYPFGIKFGQMETQVAAIVRQLRPVNAWEENDNIAELTPRPVVLNGRKYVEYRIYQATFFPFATRAGAGRLVSLPAVPLTVSRSTNAVLLLPTDPASGSTTTTDKAASPPPKMEAVTFVSQPVTVTVRPLPPHRTNVPGNGQVSVGTFRLTGDVDRNRVALGQSVRYTIRIEGRGNIAGIQPPQSPPPGPDLDVFPPQVQEQIGRTDEQVSGHKLFSYFLIPKQKGTLALADRFFWVYFNPQSGHYDTLRPQTVLSVGGTADSPAIGIVPSDTLDGTGRPSIYAGLEQTDSTATMVNWPTLIRAIANVLIILMILGTLFVFTRK